MKRLKTDYVDIYQLHNPTPDQCRSGELVDALNKMDLPVVMGSVLFIALVFVIINFQYLILKIIRYLYDWFVNSNKKVKIENL